MFRYGKLYAECKGLEENVNFINNFIFLNFVNSTEMKWYKILKIVYFSCVLIYTLFVEGFDF